MTTTEPLDMTPPSPATHRLRRSTTDRIGAGVAGGLGEYFGIDPVIFRVLFATAAFFGGAGILGYLIGWAAIPEEGTEHATIDRWVSSLRRRRVPVWLMAVAAGLLLWLVAFSWWAPGPLFPVLAVVLILVAIFGRRGAAVAAPPSAPVNLEKEPDGPGTAEPVPPGAAASSSWVDESRRWLAESRAARRERLRRAFPVKVATLLVLAATLLTLGLVDAATGIAVPTYFWFALAILATGLLVGMVVRRTPWSLVVLLIPAIIGVVSLAGSRVTLHDGVGQREWAPEAAPAAEYKLAFGDATLDLGSLRPQDGPRVIRVDEGGGRLTIRAPRAMNLTVVANVHFGVVSLNGHAPDRSGGVAVSRLIEPLPGATGQPIRIDVHLADGQVDLERS